MTSTITLLEELYHSFLGLVLGLSVQFMNKCYFRFVMQVVKSLLKA